MKIVAIIQARMGSERLRGKSLMPIAGKTLLYRVVDGVKKLDFIDKIIIATTDLPEDDLIEHSAKKLGISVYRGSSLNLLERFYNASLIYSDQDTIVRFTADNPLNNSILTEKLFKSHGDGDFDYSYIDGLSHIVAEFIKVKALREAFLDGDTNQFDKEHVTPYFRRSPKRFKLNTKPKNFCGLRNDLDSLLTVDTKDEFIRMEKLIEENEIDKKEIDFDQIYKWLDKLYL